MNSIFRDDFIYLTQHWLENEFEGNSRNCVTLPMVPILTLRDDFKKMNVKENDIMLKGGMGTLYAFVRESLKKQALRRVLRSCSI